MHKSIPALLAVALLCVAPPASPVSDNITATADVQIPLSVTGSSDLDFGNVFPGVNKAVAYTDAVNAGQWDITGQGSAEVTLSFTVLPANLTFAANSLPIAYAANDAAHHTTDAPGAATSFDPSVGATTNLGAAPAELYIWIGATVQPDPAQVAGTYTATITLDVAYTGN